MDYAREKWTGVWDSHCNQGLFLLLHFSVQLFVCSVYSQTGPLFVSTRWLSEVPGANPSSFKTSEIEQESLSHYS